MRSAKAIARAKLEEKNDPEILTDIALLSIEDKLDKNVACRSTRSDSLRRCCWMVIVRRLVSKNGKL